MLHNFYHRLNLENILSSRTFKLIYITVYCGFALYFYDPRNDNFILEVLFFTFSLILLAFDLAYFRKLSIHSSPVVGTLFLLLSDLLSSLPHVIGMGSIRWWDLHMLALLFFSAPLNLLYFVSSLPVSLLNIAASFLILLLIVCILGLSIKTLMLFFTRKGFVISSKGKILGGVYVALFFMLRVWSFHDLDILFFAINATDFLVILASSGFILLTINKNSRSEIMLLILAFVPLWLALFVSRDWRWEYKDLLNDYEVSLSIALFSYLPIILCLFLVPAGALIINETFCESWTLISGIFLVSVVGLLIVWFAPYSSSWSYFDGSTIQSIYMTKYRFYEPSIYLVVESLRVLLLWFPIVLIKFMRFQ